MSRKLYSIGLIFSVLILASCGAGKSTSAKKPLYEVLTQQENGGGNIQFYEIISDESEIGMLLGDEYLQGKVKASDIKTANFVILNLGEKRSGGYRVGVEKVEEFPDKIVVTVKEIKPDGLVTLALTYPYAVVKINSKKPIEIQ
ncbi:PrcB C-terminal domain-containing protein [Flavobacterium longum]|uniref:protease complex subunit PrcB family protein n=1 Tax=Flavobacterium longum TaxID=1299340 RepID=UPI0039EB3344